MGYGNHTKLYLAAYYWQDEDCISFTRGQGYGIIQPNGLDSTVEVMAKGEWHLVPTFICKTDSAITEKVL